MSYANRNSLILGVLLVLVLSAGWYWIRVHQDGRTERLQARERALKTELAGIQTSLAIYDVSKAELARMETRSHRRRQFLPAADDPAAMLLYLQAGLRSPADFDFRFEGPRPGGPPAANLYNVRGEGGFDGFYALLRHLEAGSRFCAVEGLTLEYGEPEEEEERSAQMKFSMEIGAYYDAGADSVRLTARRPVAEPRVTDPFRPLVARTLPPNSEGLFDAESGRLRGLAPNLAYLVDASGREHMLREGDRVYLGRLAKIDIAQNRVEFVLNKGGFLERVRLEAAIPPATR